MSMPIASCRYHGLRCVSAHGKQNVGAFTTRPFPDMPLMSLLNDIAGPRSEIIARKKRRATLKGRLGRYRGADRSEDGLARTALCDASPATLRTICKIQADHEGSARRINKSKTVALQQTSFPPCYIRWRPPSDLVLQSNRHGPRRALRVLDLQGDHRPRCVIAQLLTQGG